MRDRESNGAPKRVLLLEDDPHVRNVLAKMIPALGFEAIVTCSVEMCLSTARSRDETIDILLLDVDLRDGDGIGLAHAVRAARARIPLILMTGGAFGLNARDLAALVPAPIILEKPFGAGPLNGALHGWSLARDAPLGSG